MLTSHVGPAGVLPTPFLIQLPAGMPGKAVADDPSAWAPDSVWETERKLRLLALA